MLKDAVAVLDVGSSKLTAMIGERAVNNNFSIRAIVEKPQDALGGGEIINLKSLESASVSAINEVCNSAKASINELFVGVPGEFIQIRNRKHTIILNKKRRVKKSDLEDLYNGASASIDEQDYEIVDKSAVCYFLDGNARVSDPTGQITETLSGYITFFLCRKAFANAIRAVLSSFRIKTIHFVPIPLAESLFLFDRQERNAYSILVDIGFITTSVSVIFGDGMLYQGAFPQGGGFISGQLCEDLGIDFDLANKLKRKINLSVDSPQGFYEVFVGDEQYTFDISASNKAVCTQLDVIAENIDKHLSASQVRLPHSNISVSLTGGGVCFIRGAKEFLSKRLEMGVNVVAPNIPFLNKPDESSKLSLLDYSLNFKKKNK